jgi:putative ABC transport system permease protein
MNDLKFALRQLLKNPGFTTVAVLMLSLGIGANTAIFSFVNTILLRPLPFKEPDELVMVFTSYLANDSHKNWVTASTFEQWRKQGRVFEGLAARSFGGFVLTGEKWLIDGANGRLPDRNHGSMAQFQILNSQFSMIPLP